ncbi:MAG: hypothetical protein GY740_20985, partial [Gammaproteobacteria bacterium]|nr:hypothetical protein [Gammaproteobacteria bacterium]
LVKNKMWNSDSTNNPQLMGLTIGNLRGEYVSALLPEIVITEEDVPPCLPEALTTFFNDHTFFVWNRQKMEKYFLEEMGYTIGPNFVSIDGLLQVADIHIGCILRTVANSDMELEEMVQLVCSAQTLHATVADNMTLLKAMMQMAAMTATAANLLVHVLYTVVQVYTPAADSCSKWIRQQWDLLQLQLKIDPVSLLQLEAKRDDDDWNQLALDMTIPDDITAQADQIAKLIMDGRKSNREQYFLGSGAEETFDYMTTVNRLLNA